MHISRIHYVGKMNMQIFIIQFKIITYILDGHSTIFVYVSILTHLLNADSECQKTRQYKVSAHKVEGAWGENLQRKFFSYLRLT